MNAQNLIESFSEFKEFKNIDRETMMNVLEDVFRTVMQKQYGTDENVDVIINIDKGDLELWRNREIVKDGEIEDENLQIAYSDAVKIEPDFEVGEEVSEQIFLKDFGRRQVLALRQTLSSRIMDLEKKEVYDRYEDRIGEIVNGEIYQVWRNEVLVLDGEENELILPKSEAIPSDYFKKGDSIRAVVKSVEMRNHNPLIIISRTAPEFLARLFDQEVPEVSDGLITIKKIVRVPGERAKVAVESYDERIDPVGACVGMKGARIHGIVRELKNENIDVINFTENTQLFISRSLNPAKVTSIEINEDDKKANVYLHPDQVSLAIGRGGFNIRLASMITGYEIDVYRNVDELDDDVELTEFGDEIEGWIIDQLKSIGCDTARDVLNLDVADLIKRTDLEEETVVDVIQIIKAELE
ncbi:MAG: transcription termination factor NusA [Flavobacteriales bacterium]|jgi:N utilization substance protein A|tara:strand:+ start:1658 stop:2893 length:1236 start_codon:yes stop_codon:yes gene_type:complete